MGEANTRRRRGRPPRVNGEGSCVRVLLRLAPSEHARLRVVARAQGQPISEVLRDAVNEYVADYGERAVFDLIATARRRAEAQHGRALVRVPLDFRTPVIRGPV